MSSGWWLGARARHSVRAIVAILALAAAEFILGGSAHQIDGENNTLTIPWAVVIPVAAAAVIGVSTRSAARDQEITTARSLPELRALHLGALLALAVAATAVGSFRLVPSFPTDLSGPAAVRNLVAFTGLSLASAALLGSSLAWPVPLTLAIAATTVGASGGTPRWWALPIHPDADPLAAALSVTLLVIGAGLVIRRGPREPAAERD